VFVLPLPLCLAWCIAIVRKQFYYRFTMNGSVSENDLNEVQAIRLGWNIDPIKVILIAMPIVLVVMGVIQIYQDRSVPVSGLGTRVPYAAYVLGLYTVFFVWFIWSPWRRGRILIDKKGLSVPRFFRVQVFERGMTEVVVDSLSAEFHVCTIKNSSQSAVFMVNAQSASLLRAWATPPTNESAGNEEDK
jgi:hypothetical protein